MYTPS
jgi:dynein heavy chain